MPGIFSESGLPRECVFLELCNPLATTDAVMSLNKQRVWLPASEVGQQPTLSSSLREGDIWVDNAFPDSLFDTYATAFTNRKMRGRTRSFDFLSGLSTRTFLSFPGLC